MAPRMLGPRSERNPEVTRASPKANAKRTPVGYRAAFFRNLPLWDGECHSGNEDMPYSQHVENARRASRVKLAGTILSLVRLYINHTITAQLYPLSLHGALPIPGPADRVRHRPTTAR